MTIIKKFHLVFPIVILLLPLIQARAQSSYTITKQGDAWQLTM